MKLLKRLKLMGVVIAGVSLYSSSVRAIDINPPPSGNSVSDVYESLWPGLVYDDDPLTGDACAPVREDMPLGGPYTNRQRATLGIPPTSGGMPLNMTYASGTVTLQFPTVIGKRYQVQTGQVVDLAEADWITVEECEGPRVYKAKMVHTPVGPEVIGDGNEKVVTLSVTLVSGEPQYFSYKCLGDQNLDGDLLGAWEENELGRSDTVFDQDVDGDGSPDFMDAYPNDYFNGSAPTITIIAGNGQTGNRGAYSASAQVVRVTGSGGLPLINAPVRFRTLNGDALLATGTMGTATVAELEVRTDVDGEAQVWTYIPANSFASEHSTSAYAIVGSSMPNVLFAGTANLPLDLPSLPTSGLKLWFRADQGHATAPDGYVESWLNQSGTTGHATQSTATARPRKRYTSELETPALYFDGVDDNLVLPDVLSSMSQGEIFVVLKANSDTPSTIQAFGHFGPAPYSLIPVYPHVDGVIYETFGTTTRQVVGDPGQALDQWHLYNVASKAGLWEARINGLLVAKATSNTVAFTSLPVLGSSYYGSNWYPFAGQMAEVLIFDRTLSLVERGQVEKYFSQKYPVLAPEPTTPQNIRALALSQGEVSVLWGYDLGNTKFTFEVERKAGAGPFELVQTVPHGKSWIDAGLTPGTQYTYRVRASNGALASAYATSSTVTPTESDGSTIFPTTAIKLWFKADAGVTSPMSAWTDQSGQQVLAHQTTSVARPLLMSGSVPAVHFDGSDDRLVLPDVLSSSTQGEIFVVLKANSDTPSTIQAFGHFGPAPYSLIPVYPDVDGVIYETFGTTTRQVVGDPGQALDQWHLYNVASKAGLWEARINGLLVAKATSNTVAFTSLPVIGASYYSSTLYPFAGEISELLLFDRVLSALERETVQKYLGIKTLIPNFDPDRDGLTTALELTLGSNPAVADSNKDGLSDGDAHRMGLSLTSSDTDNDGVFNGVELANGTNPLLADTDRDGVNDLSDAYPLDPTRSSTSPPDPGDSTPPSIQLALPSDAVPVP